MIEGDGDETLAKVPLCWCGSNLAAHAEGIVIHGDGQPPPALATWKNTK